MLLLFLWREGELEGRQEKEEGGVVRKAWLGYFFCFVLFCFVLFCFVLSLSCSSAMVAAAARVVQLVWWCGRGGGLLDLCLRAGLELWRSRRPVVE